MTWHWRTVAIVAVCLGCRSPNCWNPFGATGTRVPPPPTGSYGTPNTYYQPTFPSTATPVPQGVRPLGPTSQWKTARDDREFAEAGGGAAPQTSLTLPPNPEQAGTARPVVSTTIAPSGASSLKGMPVNEARAPAQEPGTSTSTGSATGPPPSLAAVNAGARQAPSVASTSTVAPAAGRSLGAVTTASWQTRDEPAP